MRGQNRTPHIPPPKLRHHLRHLPGLILMHKVSCVRENLQLVFTLHLADHEVLVQTVGAGEDEEFGRAAGGEEFGA